MYRNLTMKTEEQIKTEKTITDAIEAILNFEWDEIVSTCGLTYGEINELEKYNN